MVERDLGNEKLITQKRIFGFIGPEGSGKTLQSKKLSKDLGVPYLSTSETLRRFAQEDKGRLGEACRVMFEEHTYLAGDLLLEIMSEEFRREIFANGFILDGGFRTVEETLRFAEVLENSGRNYPVLIFKLNIDPEVSCERCIFSSNARNRTDDTKEALGKRLEKYYSGLKERLEIIKSNPNWELVEINASESENEVYTTLLGFLSKKGYLKE